jgi:AcrR family transcriptional regulator
VALGAKLFASRSYDELSMAGVAREAGVSKALLYHYFPSKRDYFAAILHLLGVLRGALRAAG